MTEEYRIDDEGSAWDRLLDLMQELSRGRPSEEIREIITAANASEIEIIIKRNLDELRDLDPGLSEEDRRGMEHHTLSIMRDLNGISRILLGRIRELDAKHFGKGGSE